MNKKILAIVALVLAIALGGAIGVFAAPESSSSNCQTFTRTYQPGLMDTFKGRVCTTSPGVVRIASQYNQCVKQTKQSPQCGYALLSYLAASGAYPEDAAKATLLVLQAASGQ